MTGLDKPVLAGARTSRRDQDGDSVTSWHERPKRMKICSRRCKQLYWIILTFCCHCWTKQEFRLPILHCRIRGGKMLSTQIKGDICLQECSNILNQDSARNPVLIPCIDLNAAYTSIVMHLYGKNQDLQISSDRPRRVSKSHQISTVKRYLRGYNSIMTNLTHPYFAISLSLPISKAF